MTRAALRPPELAGRTWRRMGLSLAPGLGRAVLAVTVPSHRLSDPI